MLSPPHDAAVSGQHQNSVLKKWQHFSAVLHSQLGAYCVLQQCSVVVLYGLGESSVPSGIQHAKSFGMQPQCASHWCVSMSHVWCFGLSATGVEWQHVWFPAAGMQPHASPQVSRPLLQTVFLQQNSSASLHPHVSQSCTAGQNVAVLSQHTVLVSAFLWQPHSVQSSVATSHFACFWFLNAAADGHGQQAAPSGMQPHVSLHFFEALQCDSVWMLPTKGLPWTFGQQTSLGVFPMQPHAASQCCAELLHRSILCHALRCVGLAAGPDDSQQVSLCGQKQAGISSGAALAMQHAWPAWQLPGDVAVQVTYGVGRHPPLVECMAQCCVVLLQRSFLGGSSEGCTWQHCSRVVLKQRYPPANGPPSLQQERPFAAQSFVSPAVHSKRPTTTAVRTLANIFKTTTEKWNRKESLWNGEVGEGVGAQRN